MAHSWSADKASSRSYTLVHQTHPLLSCLQTLVEGQGAQYAHQEARLIGFDAFLQRLLNVDGPADAVLCGTQRQLNLCTVMLFCLVCRFRAWETVHNGRVTV
jgi:hypothetical protein